MENEKRILSQELKNEAQEIVNKLPKESMKAAKEAVSVRKNDPGYAPQRLGARQALDDLLVSAVLERSAGRKISPNFFSELIPKVIRERDLFPEWYTELLTKFCAPLTDIFNNEEF